MELPKKKGSHIGRGIAIFIALVLFFLILRFPYAEIKHYIIRQARSSMGLYISAKDFSLLFPVGIAFKELELSSKRKNMNFSLPRMETLDIEFPLMKLLSGSKALRFELVNGGQGSGLLELDGEALKAVLKFDEINMAGIAYEEDIRLAGGSISLDSDISFQTVDFKGQGSIDLNLTDIIAIGINPLMPELEIKGASIKGTLTEEIIDLSLIDVDIEGISLKGSGMIRLKKNIKSSSLDLQTTVDLSGASKGRAKDFLPFISTMVKGKDSFSLKITGTIETPKIYIDGTKLAI